MSTVVENTAQAAQAATNKPLTLKAVALWINSKDEKIKDTFEVPLFSNKSTIRKVETVLRNWADYRGFKPSFMTIEFNGSRFKFKDLKTKWKMISTRLSSQEFDDEVEGLENVRQKTKDLKNDLLNTRMAIDYMPTECIEKLPEIKSKVDEIEGIMCSLMNDPSFKSKLGTEIIR